MSRSAQEKEWGRERDQLRRSETLQRFNAMLADNVSHTHTHTHTDSLYKPQKPYIYELDFRAIGLLNSFLINPCPNSR